jgi:hypothetical protein
MSTCIVVVAPYTEDETVFLTRVVQAALKLHRNHHQVTGLVNGNGVAQETATERTMEMVDRPAALIA